MNGMPVAPGRALNSATEPCGIAKDVVSFHFHLDGDVADRRHDRHHRFGGAVGKRHDVALLDGAVSLRRAGTASGKGHDDQAGEGARVDHRLHLAFAHRALGGGDCPRDVPLGVRG